MSDKKFKLITREMAADILSCSLTTLDALVASGTIPAPKPLGSNRRVYWLPEEIEGHLRQVLGNRRAVDSKPQVRPSNDQPQLVLASNPPKCSSARPKRTKSSSLKNRRSTRIERLNE
jgi:excisionase family DNA binding protein